MDSETKRQGRYELILLFAIGFKPKALISLGYSEQTVYKYQKYFEKSKEIINDILIKRVV